MSFVQFIQKKPALGNSVYVDSTAVVSGDLTMGDDCSVWPQAVIRADVNTITIGKGTNIQDNCVLHVTHDGPYSPGGASLNIGNYVTVGHCAVLHACAVEDLCLIGINAVILDKAIVRKNCLIGAGSLVLSGMDLEGGYLWAGSPVKKIRPLIEKELAFFEYSAENYIKLKNDYFASAFS